MTEEKKEKTNIYLEHLDQVYGPGPIDVTSGMSHAATLIRDINSHGRKAASSPGRKNSPKTDLPDTRTGHANRTREQDTPTGHTGQTPRTHRTDQQGTLDRPPGHTGQSTGTHEQDTPAGHTGHTKWVDDFEDLPLLDRSALELRASRIISRNHRRVFQYIVRIGKRVFFTSYDEIGNELGMPFATVRKACTVLRNQGIIQSRKVYDPVQRKQGQEFMFMGPVHEEDPNRTYEQNTPTGQTIDPSKIDRDNKNLSIKEKLLSISDDEMAMVLPNLYRAGFTCSSLHQAVEKREKFGFSLDLVMTFLRYAEFELEHGIMVDKDGGQVRSPSDYLFKALASGKAYRRPKGYLDPEEEALAEEEQRRKDLARKKEQIENETFEAWEKSLTDNKRAELDEERKKYPHPMPMSAFLKHVWRTQYKTD